MFSRKSGHSLSLAALSNILRKEQVIVVGNYQQGKRPILVENFQQRKRPIVVGNYQQGKRPILVENFQQGSKPLSKIFGREWIQTTWNAFMYLYWILTFHNHLSKHVMKNLKMVFRKPNYVVYFIKMENLQLHCSAVYRSFLLIW